MTVFVAGALKGEEVYAEIIKSESNYATAKVLKLNSSAASSPIAAGTSRSTIESGFKMGNSSVYLRFTLYA